MIHRQVIPLLRQKLASNPAVALLGPRQVGKTTLARTLSSLYYDLEQPPDRLRIDLEWEKIEKDHGLVIFDEAQTYPELFPRLRGAIDRDRKRNNRFLLLGSISPSLMHQVSESLAGRLSLCELTPFLSSELPSIKKEELWLKGGFPAGGILRSRNYPEWQENYLTLLAQRDLPQWGLPAKPLVTERLFKMLAIMHGQVWNASQVGKSLSLSYHTVNSYLDYLESAYLIRRLPPYERSFKKRIIKSPKIYLRDSGLLHSLFGIRHHGELLAQPWVGYSWEGWIIEQILSYLKIKGKTHQAFFLRTRDQQEIDLILEIPPHLFAIEIKLTTNPAPQDMHALKKMAQPIGRGLAVLLSRTPKTVKSQQGISTNLSGFLELLTDEKI